LHIILRAYVYHSQYMLQCVAVCCSVLQSVAVCRIMWRCIAVCCSVLQLLYETALRELYIYMLQCVAVCCNALQCVAVGCSALQCAAVCCSRDMRAHSYISMWLLLLFCERVEQQQPH